MLPCRGWPPLRQIVVPINCAVALLRSFFGWQASFKNRPSSWMENKSPVKLKYSPVKPLAENFNWMGLLETMLACVGFPDPCRPIMTGFEPSIFKETVTAVEYGSDVTRNRQR
jgi:hypothetical protein